MPPDPIPASAPPATTVEDPNALTPAEQEFFSSRGTKTDGLVAPDPATPPAAPIVPGVPSAAPGAVATDPAVTPPAPSPEFEEGDEPGEPGKPPKRVNYNKWKRTSDELTSTKGELAKMRDTSTRLDERMRLINEALATTPAQAQAAEDADPAPDPEKDIFGYVRWQGRQIEKLNGELTGVRQETKAAADEVQLSNWYRNDAQTYFQQEPAFGLAYVHLIQNRLRELEAGGIADKTQRDRIVVEEERAVVEKARRDGVSPSKRLFELAVGRGFDREKALAARAAPPAANGGTAPALAAPAAAVAPGTPLGSAAAVPATPTAAPAAPNVAAEIQRIKDNQSAATSLSSGGGSAPEALTPQMLADMPQEEFAAVLSRLSKGRQRELLGGLST